MTPIDFYKIVMIPGIAKARLAAPEITWGRNTQVLMVAIAGQESGWTFRMQAHGPAHGLFQFELEGISDLLVHPITGPILRAAAKSYDVSTIASEMWHMLSMPEGDGLAVLLARLLLWSDSQPIPPSGDEIALWRYYCFNWRPGRPRPLDWETNWKAAMLAVPD